MKGNLVVIGLFIALAVSAQTNHVIFQQLLSPANSILMTNAEFRCYSGNKIFFRNEAGYRYFLAGDLNTNILTTLGTSEIKLNLQQAALEAANQKYKDSREALKAQQNHQEKLQAQIMAGVAMGAQKSDQPPPADTAGNHRRKSRLTERGSIGVGAP